jgi:predicted nuclease of predicted toxin-antitoxin system
LRYAIENDWILLTFDDDFFSLVETGGIQHEGLIYIRQIGDVVKIVDEHLQTRAEDDRSIQYL